MTDTRNKRTVTLIPIAEIRDDVCGNAPTYDYSAEGGMRRADGQGYPLSGSEIYERWPRRLLKVLNPGSTKDFIPVPRWCDHPRKERKRGAPIRYVCHPYGLTPDAFRDFLTLEAAGWRVNVSGDSNYYPGGTVRVEVWRETTA